jgi:hypothetical protein
MTQIPKIVGQRLRAVTTPGEHPDPNLLGAFLERSLAKREQVEVLEHLSRCTSCREIVSLSATQPGMAEAASAVRVSPGWFSLPVLRWGAAVACVMVVGAAVTLHRRQESRTFTNEITKGKPAATATQISASDSGIEKKVASVQVPKSDAKAAFAGRQAASRENAANDNHAATDSRPVEMADARTASPFSGLVPGRAKDALAESQGAQAAQATRGPLATKRSTTAASDPLALENLIPRWTLSSDGTLQRSLDSGMTWETIPVSSQTIFRALAANGLNIWVGGAAGALFHSSDAGEHWTQVRPMVNGETLVDDIIGVEFRDALHGKLTSSMEGIWITADAGQTWQKQ